MVAPKHDDVHLHATMAWTLRTVGLDRRGAVQGIRFGLAFCEASGNRLVR